MSKRHLVKGLNRSQHPDHAAFYRAEGLAALHRHLAPDGHFALWADGQPDPEFLARLKDAFAHAEAQTITFDNPLTESDSHGTVYLAAKTA
ncbi:MAG: hypothetical protein GVY36_13025 [Verrucomicrobia bacterium]|jgi:hypothetical protein|nr:hypothetical protein [Verrucomicrobiota bacterium]